MNFCGTQRVLYECSDTYNRTYISSDIFVEFKVKLHFRLSYFTKRWYLFRSAILLEVVLGGLVVVVCMLLLLEVVLCGLVEVVYC